MANEVIIGFKSKLTVDGTAFPNAVMIQIPAREFGEVEVTKLDQATIDRVFMATLRDNGNCTCEVFFNDADYARCLALHGKNDKDFVCTTPDPDGLAAGLGKVFTMTGFLKKIGEIKAEKDQPMKFTIEIRVNKIVITSAPNATE